jgi:hypothetical protein
MTRRAYGHQSKAASVGGLFHVKARDRNPAIGDALLISGRGCGTMESRTVLLVGIPMQFG